MYVCMYVWREGGREGGIVFIHSPRTKTTSRNKEKLKKRPFRNPTLLTWLGNPPS